MKSKHAFLGLLLILPISALLCPASAGAQEKMKSELSSGAGIIVTRDPCARIYPDKTSAEYACCARGMKSILAKETDVYRRKITAEEADKQLVEANNIPQPLMNLLGGGGSSSTDSKVSTRFPTDEQIHAKCDCYKEVRLMAMAFEGEVMAGMKGVSSPYIDFERAKDAWCKCSKRDIPLCRQKTCEEAFGDNPKLMACCRTDGEGNPVIALAKCEGACGHFVNAEAKGDVNVTISGTNICCQSVFSPGSHITTEGIQKCITGFLSEETPPVDDKGTDVSGTTTSATTPGESGAEGEGEGGCSLVPSARRR